MSQVFQFTPSQVQNFQFQPELDGQLYTAQVVFLAYGQRYYLVITDSTGTEILRKAVIGSPDQVQINSIAWDFASQRVRASVGRAGTPFTGALNAQAGRTLNLVIQGCSPDAYNGVFQCLVLDIGTISYPLASDPGMSATLGTAGFEENLIQGYFKTSRMVFRASTQQFIVTP